MLSPLLLWSEMEILPWGNLRGLRVEDTLVPLETWFELQVDDGPVQRTAHYAQRSDYRHLGHRQRVVTYFPEAVLHQEFTAVGSGQMRLDLELTASAPASTATAALCCRIPGGPSAQILLHDNRGPLTLPPGPDPVTLEPADGSLLLTSGSRTYQLECPSAGPIRLAWETAAEAPSLRLEFPLRPPAVWEKGGQAGLTLVASVATETLPSTVDLRVVADRRGRLWEGIGGNFRLQHPAHDPLVIDYNLEHLPARWGRVSMGWRDWDPQEEVSPAQDWQTRELPASLHAQLRLGQKLAARGIPLILSAWYPPAWAVQVQARRPGTYGDPLRPQSLARQVESIVAYLLMMRARFGLEPALFSFNEPEIGVSILQDPDEHVRFMGALAAALQAAGLRTRILAADTSNATPYARSFAAVAGADPLLRPHLGAIGFHTWGGCESVNLRAWSDLADRLGLPLLVTEGGQDSEAHRNPDLFRTARYQFDQAELYLRLLSVAQASAILEWQFTADYSLLEGAGLLGQSGPLSPTFRFHLLAHLGLTPAGYRHVPATLSQPDLACAAFADDTGSGWVIHFLNSGPALDLAVSGLPPRVGTLVPVVSTLHQGLRRESPVPVVDGTLSLAVPARCLLSLLCPSPAASLENPAHPQPGQL